MGTREIGRARILRRFVVMAAPDSVPNPPSSTMPTPSVAGIPHTSTPAAAATGTAIGAAAGAAAGAIAGPPGILAGAVLGAIAGAATAGALVENDEVETAANEELDQQ